MKILSMQCCNILTISLWLSTFAAQAADPLQTFLTGFETLQAEFVQTVIATKKPVIRAATGVLYVKRPNRFRWDYTVPRGQQVLADGSRVWVYDPELAQVSHQSQKEALRGTPALLLSSKDPVAEHFTVTDLGKRQNLDWLELVPKDNNSEIVKVQLAFSGSILDRFEMVDVFGQTTRFLFRQVRRNLKLADEMFTFDPPPAVDILGN